MFGAVENLLQSVQGINSEVQFVFTCFQRLSSIHSQYKQDMAVGWIGFSTSSRKRKHTPATVNNKPAEITFGNAYFHLCIHSTPFSPPKNVPGPNSFDAGDLPEVGSARNPPSIGPKTAPKLKVRGRMRKAREWYLKHPSR